jgi:hypothetical protein
MAAQAQRLAVLEQQVADLAARLEEYRQQAVMVHAVEDVIARMGPAGPAPRPARHLHAVPDLEPEPELEAGA